MIIKTPLNGGGRVPRLLGCGGAMGCGGMPPVMGQVGFRAISGGLGDASSLGLYGVLGIVAGVAAGYVGLKFFRKMRRRRR